MRAFVFVLAAAWAAPADAQQLDTFRLTDLDLRDPHLFVELIGCRDITPHGALGFSVNDELQASLVSDEDGDGELDASYLLQFVPLDQAQATNFLAAGAAACTAPVESTVCGPFTSVWLADDATLSPSGTCLGAIGGTVRPYDPAVTATTGPCFVSPEFTFTFDLGGIPVTLRDAQVGATFDVAPAQMLTNGLLRGFISETDANNTTIPASTPLVGGQPLSSLLPGGTNNCASFSDKDTHEGVMGWWFYFNFPATRATFVVELFADGFEG